METTQIFHADLVERCRANDRQAQLMLYRQYCEGMYCVAMRFLKNEDDAEDVLQEAFIKAFQKLDQFSGQVTFGAWLKRIVINKCIDFLKSRKMDYVELKEHSLRVVEHDDWNIAEEITLDEIKSAMEEIPEKYGLVVQMYLVEGLDHEEISEVLGLSETACRTRLMRGRAMLKKLLKEKYYVTGS